MLHGAVPAVSVGCSTALPCCSFCPKVGKNRRHGMECIAIKIWHCCGEHSKRPRPSAHMLRSLVPLPSLTNSQAGLGRTAEPSSSFFLPPLENRHSDAHGRWKQRTWSMEATPSLSARTLYDSYTHTEWLQAITLDKHHVIMAPFVQQIELRIVSGSPRGGLAWYRSVGVCYSYLCVYLHDL